MHISHNTAPGGDSENSRILGFWIEREVQDPPQFTWFNQELDKEQIDRVETQKLPRYLDDIELVLWCWRNSLHYMC